MKYLLFVSILSTAIAVNLTVLYSWKFVDFTWDSPEQKQAAIDSGDYIPTAVVLYDADEAPDGTMFVTSVRDKGVPASVMTVSKEIGKGGPLLSPYPDWSWYDNKDCKGIISVYRVFIKCNHIFVLDCGTFGEKKVCPAQLLIFDLSTNFLVKRVIIPDNIAANKNRTGLLVTPIVYARDCEDIKNNAIVYMADVEGFGLVIWNARTSSLCRIESSYMKPTDTTFTIANQSFTLDDGILGITVLNKDLYYAPLAGTNMYKMYRELLNCNHEFLSNKNVTDKLTQYVGTLQGQTGPIASMDCAIFFSNIPQTSIMCADSSKPINSNNMDVVAQNTDDFQFPSGLKVFKDKLLTTTNRYQKTVANDDFDINETNFCITSIDIGEIKRDTNCFDSCTDVTVIWYKHIFDRISRIISSIW